MTASISAIKQPDLFDPLSNYVANLYLDWFTYRQLFGESAASVEKLNRYTGRVFRRFQDAMLDRILLELAKLFDKAKTAGKVTGSLSRALDELPLPANDPRRSQLQQELSALEVRLKPLLDHRHRRIAHNDRVVFTQAKVLPGVSRKMIGDAIEQTATFFNKMLEIKKGSQMAFSLFARQTGVDVLFKVLDAGNAKLDEKEARKNKLREMLKNGDFPPGLDPVKEFGDGV